mmetsp:Transcript_65592/g.128977  ORF Transcript_65592/g.128977 Transcript_65592/m.128977 type:complete len:227 (-) Transcript_65592:29-709(-)
MAARATMARSGRRVPCGAHALAAFCYRTMSRMALAAAAVSPGKPAWMARTRSGANMARRSAVSRCRHAATSSAARLSPSKPWWLPTTPPARTTPPASALSRTSPPSSSVRQQSWKPARACECSLGWSTLPKRATGTSADPWSPRPPIESWSRASTPSWRKIAAFTSTSLSSLFCEGAHRCSGYSRELAPRKGRERKDVLFCRLLDMRVARKYVGPQFSRLAKDPCV